MSVKFLLLLTFFKLFNLSKNSTIFIPFEQFPNIESSSYDKNLFINENLNTKFVTNLSIGTPKLIIPTILNFEDTTSSIKPNDEYKSISSRDKTSNSIYLPSKSSTYKNISSDNKRIFNKYILINETIRLYNDINMKTFQEINDFQIYLRDDYMNAFSYIDISKNKNNFIINQLKEKKIINSSVISVKYIDNFNGFYIIGNYPHIYDKKNYFKEQLISFSMELSNGKNIDIYCKIFISWSESGKEKKINFQSASSFNINSNLIIAPQEYMNLIKNIFFNKYINNKICDYNIINVLGKNYLVYSCIKHNEFDITTFPTIKFNFNGNKYDFELNYKDLFMEKNNIFYFLVTCDYHLRENWRLGRPFLKKYQFIFDGEKKTASFYNLNKNYPNIKNNSIKSKGNLTNPIIILIIINLILIPLCLWIRKIKKEKKLKANEMNEIYGNNKNMNDLSNIETGLMEE